MSVVSDVLQRQGKFTHANEIMQQAKSAGIFETLEQQQTFSTSTEGLANRIAGLAIYNQVNLKTPILGAMPKIDRTGDESVNIDSDSPTATFRATFNPPSVSGVAGGGSIPSASEFDFRTVEARVKINSMTIQNDFIHDIESRLGHDTVGWDELMELGSQYVDRSLERDTVARGVVSGGDQYSADDLTVQLDRVIASEDEETNADDFAGTPYTAGDLDVYDIDRTDTGAGGTNESNWFDSTVDHGSGTLRQLTSDLVNDHIDTQIQDSTAEYENLIMITGRDTARVLSDLKESQFRYDGSRDPGREGVNDAETRFGVNVSSRISHWDGIPIVVAPTVPGQSLSRIFTLDPTPGQTPQGTEALPKIGLESYRAPDVWQAGPDQPVNPIATGNIEQKAVWAHYNEVVSRDTSAQGKIIETEE